MKNTIDFYSLAKLGLKMSQKLNSNLKGAEIYYRKNEYNNIEIEKNSVVNSETGIDQGISIRVIDKKGSLGFAFTNILNKKTIENMVNSALKMMKIGSHNRDFNNLPNRYSKYPDLKGIYDKDIKNFNLNNIKYYLKDLIDFYKKSSIFISQSANLVSNFINTYILNSNNLEANAKETVYTIFSKIIVKDQINKNYAYGFDFQKERKFNKLNIKEVVKNAFLKAKRNLNKKKIKTMKVPLVLTPSGTISLILKPILHAINAEAFYNDRSFLVGKIGKEVASRNIIINEKPLINGGVGSSKFDSEGVPCKNKKIINNGILLESGILHNSYTAEREGIESTGNAFRDSYSSIPGIGISNIILKSGNKSKYEIINKIKKGVMLDYTVDQPDIATGEFSGQILHGNLIKEGEIRESLINNKLILNLIDFYQNIEYISRESLKLGAFQAPYVKIKEVTISNSI